MSILSVRRRASWLACSALALTLGCSGRALRSDAPPHGNFTALVARGLGQREKVQESEPLVVLFSEGQALAVELQKGTIRWRRPLRVMGAPVAHARTLAVPLRGHRLLLLDVDTGETLWERPLPGEGFTGVTLSERRVVATVVTGDPERRSLVAAFSTADGRTRWTRRSSALLGVPAALGRQVFVPTPNEVIALTDGRGRELARMRTTSEVGELGRIELHGRTVLAAGAHAFIDLHGGGQSVYRIDPHTAPAFRVVEGLDPGLGHADGLAWRLRPLARAGAPREAILMARRVVMAVRLDSDGRPAGAHWIHHRDDAGEFIAMGVDAGTVTLVREDGAILRLGGHNGSVLAQLDGHGPASSALTVGTASNVAARPEGSTRDPDAVVEDLLLLIEDADPRLEPAQRLAIELLWRHERPDVRAFLYDVVQGGIRPEIDPIADALRDHARAVMAGPWGPGDQATLVALEQALEQARQGKEQHDDLVGTITQVVRTGTPNVLETLVGLLDQPGLEPEELVAITRTLRDLEDHRAVSGVADFVLRYHADPEIVHESDALLYGLDFLMTQSRRDTIDPPASKRAAEVLAKLSEDRFTVPRLRAFMLQQCAACAR